MPQIIPIKELKNTSEISEMCHRTEEPIYITKNGEGDIVLMDINAFEKREQVLKLRARVLQAEEERINGANTISVAEASKRLRERTDEM